MKAGLLKAFQPSNDRVCCPLELPGFLPFLPIPTCFLPVSTPEGFNKSCKTLSISFASPQAKPVDTSIPSSYSTEPCISRPPVASISRSP